MSAPLSFVDKYAPRSFADFIGLEKPRRILEKFAVNPYDSAWLFVGPPSTGKTSMGLALFARIRAEVIHIPSSHCTVAELEEAIGRTCHYPMFGERWGILIDEADQMTDKAQISLLSKTDATAFPKNTVFVFTSNGTDSLEPRFLSRVRRLEFSNYGLVEPIVKRLETVWRLETGLLDPPDFTRMVKDSRNNLRDCLMKLELELMDSDLEPAAPAIAIPPAAEFAAGSHLMDFEEEN